LGVTQTNPRRKNSRLRSNLERELKNLLSPSRKRNSLKRTRVKRRRRKRNLLLSRFKSKIADAGTATKKAISPTNALSR